MILSWNTDRAVYRIGGGTITGEREDAVLDFLCKKGLTMPLDIS